jgi:hypothetical protein
MSTRPTQAEAERAFDAAFPMEGAATGASSGFDAAEAAAYDAQFEEAIAEADAATEWSPASEPELDATPTVSELMPDGAGGDDVSLDDLLEEIIKAGD